MRAAVRRPARRSPRPGRLHVGQLVVVEAAVAAIVWVHRQPPTLLAPVAVLATLAVLAVVVRRHGRWAWQWADLWLRRRARGRRSTLPAGNRAATADALLDSVVSGGWLDRVDVDGVPTALWTHAGGLAVALEVTSSAALPFLSVEQHLPPVTALLPAADEGGTRFTVQVLEQTLVPASHTTDPAALSYRELTGGTVPALRRCWVAIQVIRTPADDDPAVLRADLVNATRRVLRRVRRAGLAAFPLGPDDAVIGLLGLLDAPTDGSPARVHDRWRSWQAGARSCSCFVLDAPDGADVPAALGRIRARAARAGVPTTVALAARRLDEHQLQLQVTVRAVLPDGVDPETVAAALIDGRRGGLRRLDGEQSAGVAATLPLGGFLR